MLKVLVRFKAADRNLQLYYVDPGTGREVSKSAKTKNMRDAERAALVWEQELIEHRGKDGAGWEHFRERFEDEHLAGLSKNTRKSFRTALNHFERVIHVDSLSAVTSSTFSIFKGHLLKTEKRPATTVACYLGHLQAAFNWAEVVGMIRRAPKVKSPKPGKRRMARCRPITLEEFQQMRAGTSKIAKTNPFPLQRFLDLLWLSGMRLSEALQLSWDAGPIRVDMDAKPYPLMIIQAEAQKSREDQVLPLWPDLCEWLNQTPRSERRGLVAPLKRQNGKLFDPDKAGRLIGDLGYACGIRVNDKSKFASAHDIRRAFGTRWSKLVRPGILQKMMRHKMIETTLAYYVELSVVDIGAEIWQTVPASVPKKKPRQAAG